MNGATLIWPIAMGAVVVFLILCLLAYLDVREEEDERERRRYRDEDVSRMLRMLDEPMRRYDEMERRIKPME